MTWHQRELTLEDILSDPITKEVMKADDVDPHRLSAKLKETARTWADAMPELAEKADQLSEPIVAKGNPSGTFRRLLRFVWPMARGARPFGSRQ